MRNYEGWCDLVKLRVYSKGIKFYCYPKHEDKRFRYLRTNDKSALDVYYHRHIYKRDVGEIPSGYQIHHKDHNIFNNSLENLECISRADHFKEHEEKRKIWNYSSKNLENLKAGSEKSNKSRKNNPIFSALNSKAMKAREKNLLDKGEFKTKTCIECGNDFKWLKIYPRKVFCSKACKYRNWHYRNCNNNIDRS